MTAIAFEDWSPGPSSFMEIQCMEFIPLVGRDALAMLRVQAPKLLYAIQNYYHEVLKLVHLRAASLMLMLVLLGH